MAVFAPTLSDLKEAELTGKSVGPPSSSKDEKKLRLPYDLSVRFEGERPNYTMTDLERDPDAIVRYERFMDYLADNPTALSGLNLATRDPDARIGETMRDDFTRVETALAKAAALKDAPEQIKEDYRVLRQKFDQAEVHGFKEQAERVLDYGTDLLFNYENLAALGATLFSGGTATPAVAATQTARFATASRILNASIGAAKATKEVGRKALAPNSYKVGAYYGAFGAGADAATQSLEIVTDMRDQFDPVEMAMASALTSGFGLAMYHGGKAISRAVTRRSVEDISYDVPMPNPPATKALPPPAPALPDLRIPRLDQPSGPAQQIQDVLGEATGNTQRQLLIDLRDTLQDVVTGQRKKPSGPATKFHFELAKLVAERTGGSIPFGARFAVELLDLVKKRQDVPENFRLAIEEAIKQPSPGQNIRQLIDDFLETQADDVADETQIDRVNADILAAIRAQGEGGTGLPAVISKLPSIRKLVEDIGGGEETYNKIVDGALAAARGTPQSVQSQLLYNLNKALTNFTSKYMFGKSAGFLSPYAKVSGTARLLQEKVSNEFALGTDPTKGVFGQQGQKVIQEDFAEAQRRITGSFFKQYLQAVSPLSRDKFNVSLDDAVNAELSLAVRGRSSDKPTINEAAKQIRRSYQAAGELLSREGFIDDPVMNYIPRQWKRSAIESDMKGFATLLRDVGEVKTVDDGMVVAQEMLDKKYQFGGSAGTKDYFFSANRKFEKITDDAMFEKFLNTDVQQTFFNYMHQAGMALAKKKVFGVRNLDEFKNRWVSQIASEVRQGGGGWSANETENLENLYKVITGEGVESAGNVNQGIQLVQRFALLPLATLSSFTEILLNFGVAGGASTLKGMSAALKITGAKNKQDINNLMGAYNDGFKTITEDSHKRLIDEFGLTPEEAWHEMQEFGLVMEQSLESMADRLAGDLVSNRAMQEASNKFFRYTALDQWTKFVQNVSFQSGKRLIYKHIDEIANHGDAPVTRRIQSMMDDLAEFGVDVNKAKQWAAGGKRRDDVFYKDIANGAARYANQIILQPSRQSGLKPRAHSGPYGSLIFQLMGYPTAFTNNILKRGFKRLARDTDMAAMQLGPTAMLMTAVAGATNYARTRGEGFEDKTPAEIGVDALMRWGGAGILFDQVRRAQTNVEYMGTPGLATAFFGPTISDVAGVFAYQAPVRALGTKVPGYGLGQTVFGREAMSDYREILSDTDKAIKETIIPPKIKYAKGGVVKNVPNVPEEPDERIDKMTGLPYNEQAGEAFIDEEDLPKSLLARDQ